MRARTHGADALHETLGCVRVQLKADVRHERLLRAIERLGAVLRARGV